MVYMVIPAAIASIKKNTTREGAALKETFGGTDASCRASSAVCPEKGNSLTAFSARSSAFMDSSLSVRAFAALFRTVSRLTIAPRRRPMVSGSGIWSVSSWFSSACVC